MGSVSPLGRALGVTVSKTIETLSLCLPLQKLAPLIERFS